MVEADAGANAAADMVELVVRPGRVLLLPGTVTELPVALEVRARTQTFERPRLDLSLVFDKSGSMKNEGKLVHMLQAARLLIENLSENDTVSIVAYDTNVVILDQQQPAVQKLFLAHWTDEIEAAGWTNLSGGLLAGIAEVRRGKRPGTRARVILLTDGLANRGVTTLEGLRSIARAARRDGITISTIGVGKKFDENVMSALADAGGGNYTYVPEAEAIPAVVAREIQGLLPVVCQNLKLSFRLANGVELVEQVRSETPQRADLTAPIARSKDVEIHLGDLVPGERKTVILYLRIPASPQSASPLHALHARIEYQDTGESGRSMSQERQLLFPVAASIKESQESVDQPVMDTAWLAEVLDLTYLALSGRDWELVDQAVHTISTHSKELKTLAVHGATEALREHAALLAHYGEELERLATEGKLHDHERGGDTLEDIKKDVHYRRYLLLHHRPGAAKEHDK